MSFQLDKKQRVKEILKCGKDPSYFLNTYARISHPMHGLILFDTYDFQDIFFSGDGGSTWNYGSIPHQYNDSGIKIIKALVFSYVSDETGNYINPLMWKACSIKLYLG